MIFCTAIEENGGITNFFSDTQSKFLRRPMKKFDGRAPRPLLCHIIYQKKKVYLRRTLCLFLKIKDKN